MQSSGYKIFQSGYTQSSFIRRHLAVDDKLKDVIAYAIFGNVNVREIDLIPKIDVMSAESKRIIKKQIDNNINFVPLAKRYRGSIQESTCYDRSPVNMVHELNNDTTTQFNVDYKIGTFITHISKQYIEFTYKKPTTLDPDFVVPRGKTLKYFFTRMPGIRQVEEAKLFADTNEVEDFDYMTNYKHYLDSICENSWEKLNEIIGEDLGDEAEYYSPLSETTVVQKIKTGLQTPKADHGTVTIATPFIFSFNKDFNDKLNISNFNRATINLKGNVSKSTALVKAFLYSDDNVEEDPIPVPLAPLQLECVPTLVTEISSVGDVWWALNHDIVTAKVFDYERVFRYVVSEVVSDIILKGRGETLQLSVAVRPSSYDGTFENWHNFTQVEKVCHPIAVVMQGVNALTLGISSAVALKSKTLVESLDIQAHEGVSLVYDTNAANFNKYDVYSKTINNPNYYVRTKDLYYLNFNVDANGKVISNFFNMSAFDRPVLKLKLVDSLQNAAKNGNLTEKMQVLVYQKNISGVLGVSDSMARATVH